MSAYLRACPCRANTSVASKAPSAVALPRWCCSARARGDAHEESDWDIAVFFRDEPTIDDRSKLIDLGMDVLCDTGQVIQPVTLPLRREDEESYLMLAIRSDGIAL